MRLIKQKNSTWEHKKLLGRNRFDPKYDLCYTTEPGKSYVIEPEGGELDYSQAQKDPIGFYDQVMSQNITQTKARDTSPSHGKRSYKVELTNKSTHRKIGRILMLV